MLKAILPHLTRNSLIQLYCIAQEAASGALDIGDIEAEYEACDILESVADRLREMLGDEAGSRLLEV